MKKSDLKILIVDDDPAIGAAMEAALERSGYSVVWAKDYQTAMTSVKLNDFHGVVMDCMLPQKNGVDVMCEIRSLSSRDLVVIMTSGVYRDKNFAREAQNKTHAKAFYFKPFDIEELIQLFDHEFKKLIQQGVSAIHDLMSQREFSAHDRLNCIQGTGFIHGYDLPWIYNLLSDPQIEGELEVNFDYEKAHITFNKGQITQVLLPDKASYFGMLLIEHGFTTTTALEKGLSKNDKKPIGERLVDASDLSPHAIDVVQKEQMIIRLSKTIRDASIQVHFKPGPAKKSNIAIEPMKLTELLSDWIQSKISIEWLQSIYRSRLDLGVLRGGEYSKIHILAHLPIVKPLIDWVRNEDRPITLMELLENYKSDETAALRAIHFLVLNRILIFSNPPKSDNISVSHLRNRLEKIWTEIDKQDFFTVLGVSRNAREEDIVKNYQAMAKALHPDKVPSSAPSDVKELSHKVFSLITEAYNTLNNSDKRSQYLVQLEKGSAEEALEAEAIFDKSLQYLQSGRYKDARKGFTTVSKMKGARTDVALYLIWALVLEKRAKGNHNELYETCSELLAQIPHEDRHSATFFFARGLIYGLRGELNKSYNAFKHCLRLNPNMIEAKREISALKNHSAKAKSSVFTDDLSMIVTKIFKK